MLISLRGRPWTRERHGSTGFPENMCCGERARRARRQPDNVLASLMSLPPDGIGRPHRKLVGRGEELKRLEEALTKAAGGTPTMLLVGGEAGVGKTRLFRELAGGAR